MIRRPPRSTLSSSSAASDVYKRQSEYHPTPVPGVDPYAQSAQPRLFSPALSITKMQAAETLLSPWFDNCVEHHHNAFPCYPPGPSMPATAMSFRRKVGDWPQSDREMQVAEQLRWSYKVRGLPLPDSIGCSPLKVKSMQALRDEYQAGMFETFKLIGDTHAKNQALTQECEQAMEHAKVQRECNQELLQQLSLIHISEPTRLLSISYAVFCLKKKKITN
eukprot:TRINITY_DN27823_c0_g1_i6.p1 TRINITY_DN27823_c0_g1~~TRINITY_DN27823_c0_g1_i6.p1  ORF type:complete len:220 (+),score=51.68 TRINITY_DN27823_c0_g1_i6:138-797(+)